MNNIAIDAQRLQDQFGRRVAARLSTGAADLPHDISERLRAARVNALANRKAMALQAAPVLASAGGPTLDDERVSLWQRVASALPLLALVIGLVAIHMVQNDR